MKEIDRLLSQWPRIIGLAEGIGSASVLPLGSGGGGGAGDRRHWADVVADVERAWANLPINSLGWRVVQARMAGHTLSAFATAYHVRKVDVLSANQEAIATMSHYLRGGAHEEIPHLAR